MSATPLPGSQSRPSEPFLRRMFLAHPSAVEESYGEHFAAAAGFGWALLRAGAACLVHALVPSLCEHTASDAVRALHERLSCRAAAARAAKAPARRLDASRSRG